MERCAACRRRPPLFARGAVVGLYDGQLRAFLHAFKYDGRRSLAAPLGMLLKASGVPTLEGADAVVPVPLHPWKRLRRGFNQASDLARQLDRPVVHALWRRSATRAQAGLTPGERRRNVGAAFAPSPWLTERARERAVRDRVLVLVDDILTTGATLDACALQLRRMGAAEVRVLAVARAVRPSRTTLIDLS
jgi:ComF family protein